MRNELEKILGTLTAEELQKEIVRKPMSEQYKNFTKTTLVDMGQTKKIMIASSTVENYIAKFDVYYVKDNEVTIKPKLIKEFLDQ
ncbi:MAG: hypothetical protein IR153_04815 [Flavobacterium sp.]|nr:hypothetical protein [Flavobacterium sp.]